MSQHAAANAASGFEPAEIQIKSERLVQAGKHTTLYREGVSPLTEFKYVNISRGQTVWFIWANSDDTYTAVYDHMVASFEFGKKTPRTLQEAYGPGFQPLQLDNTVNILPRQALSQPSDLVMLGSDPLGHRLPFIGKRYISCGPGCSQWHKNKSAEAIDYVMPIGTPVLASYSGWFCGY